MERVNELIELQKKEQELIATLAALEQRSKELQNQKENSSEQQGIEAQKASVQAQLATTRSEMNEKIKEIVKETISKTDEQKQRQDINLGRGEINTSERYRDKIADTFNERGKKELNKAKLVNKITKSFNDSQKTVQNQKTNEVIKSVEVPTNQNFKTYYALDYISGLELIILGVLTANLAVEIKEAILDKDSAKKWEKEIDKKEQAITEKYDKEINFTDMQLQKTIENIEKKDYNKDEKETKTKELKETICKVKLDIEKASNKEIDEKIKPARDRLEDVKEKTKNMEKGKANEEIEKQHQLELERQRQLAEQNRNR